jgi:hypothetical protein
MSKVLFALISVEALQSEAGLIFDERLRGFEDLQDYPKIYRQWNMSNSSE